jgi:tetratricopeptide (TPR) repeat protein
MSSPSDRTGEAGPRQRRLPLLRLLLTAALAAAAVSAVLVVRDRSRRHARIDAVLAALPDPARQPGELRERMLRARTQASQRDTALAGVAELGRLCHANGFSAEAEACWQLLLAEQPRDPRWAYLLADLRRLASDHEGLAAMLARTNQLAPDYSPAWLRLADLKLKSGDNAEAERAYRKRLGLLPGDPYARLGLARVALQQGQHAEARVLVERLVGDAPKFSPGHNLYAELLAADGDAARAAKVRMAGRDAGRFREADDPWLDELADRCFDYERLCIRGTTDNQTQHGDRGRAAFERAIAIRPDTPFAYELLSNLHLDAGDADRAREVCARGIARIADAKSAAPLYVNLSRAYRTLKRPTDAVRAARDGLAQAGESYELYDALGAALVEAKEHEAAVAALRAAVARNPTAANANYHLAVALIEVGRLDEAIEALHRSLAVAPTFPSTLALLAKIEMDSGREEGALKYLQPLYESNSEQPQARETMTRYYLQIGAKAEQARNLAAAERHYRAGLAIDGNHAELHARLGVLCMAQQRFADAVAAFEAYRRLQPKDPRGALYLGQAYAGAGRLVEARQILAHGVQLAEQAGNAPLAERGRQTLRQLPPPR